VKNPFQNFAVTN